jgi:hypothetical protein
MFANKTVFIVGAGASFEVGLPVGSALTRIIGDKLDIRNDGSWDNHGDKHVVQAIASLARSGNYGANMRQYAAAAQAISKAMPQAISIDNFLHTHADDPDIVTLGKIGIAASILEAEHNSHIYQQNRGEYSIDFGAIAPSWHNTFCKMLTENVQKPDLEGIFKNVAFITFNYDRCIEHYLTIWLMNYMRLSYEEACELCKTLTIFHPYGQVGKLPWQSPTEGVGFGDGMSEYSILNTAKQIRTFTERVEDDEMLGKMRSALSEASTVIYLGFAYASMNMELMTLHVDGTRKNVYGTAFAMSAPNRDQAERRIRKALTVKDSGTMVTTLAMENMTANQLLNDYWYKLSR